MPTFQHGLGCSEAGQGIRGKQMVNAALAASLAFGGQPLRGAEEEAEGQVWQTDTV